MLEKNLLFVESYALNSDLVKRKHYTIDNPQIISYTVMENRSRYRFVYNIPENSIRLIQLKKEYFDSNLGLQLGDLLVQYINLSPLVEYFEPSYYHLDTDKPYNNSELINRLFNEESQLRDKICWALEQTKKKNEISLHGRFIMGSILFQQNKNLLYVLNGKTKFMGPIEYDIAAALQNTFELMFHSKIKNQDPTNLINFYRSFYRAVNANFNIDKNLLSYLLLYFYVGHLNSFQITQKRYARTLLHIDNAKKAVVMYWTFIKKLILEDQ